MDESRPGIHNEPGTRSEPGTHNELSGLRGGQAIQTGVQYGDTYINHSGVEVRVPDEIGAPEGFVNRVPERERAQDLLGGGRSKVVVFTGLPGAGKTTTARQVAADTGGYPGGKLEVPLGRHRAAAGVAVSDVLADVLLRLGVHGSALPSTLEGRAALYRTLTSDKDLLVLLDDVAEPAEIEPFVPRSAGGNVLVTSNLRLTDLLLPEDAVIDVGALPADAGSELMQSICGNSRAEREPAAMRELSELCGGFPEMLLIAAAQLRGEPSLRVAELVAEYRATGAKDLTAPMDGSYRRLPPDAARLYRRLGLVRLPDFGRDLVATLADGEIPLARRAFRALLEAHLVVDDGSGRYRMHDLVAAHARTCADSDETLESRASVVRAVVAHYLDRAGHADLAVLGAGRLRIADLDLDPDRGPFAGKQEALEWLDSERAALIAVLQSAVDGRLHREAWQLAEAMTTLYVNRRYLTEWVAATELGVRAAELDEQPAAVARLRSYVSRAFTDLGLLDRARAELEAALPVAEALHRPRLLASVWELIGRYRDAERNPGEGRISAGSATDAYHRALELFDAAEDERGKAFVLVFLGTSQDGEGRGEQALETLREAHDRCAAVPDARMAERARTALGRVQTRLGRHDEAIDTLTAAAQGLVAGGDRYYAAQAKEALAEAAEAAGNTALRDENLRQVLDEHVRIASPRVAELRAALEG